MISKNKKKKVCLTAFSDKYFLRSGGFTILELLVVISIIGLFASLITISISGAKAKARDNERAANVYSIAEALHLYHNEHNRYPMTVPAGVDLTGSDPVSTSLSNAGFIDRVPVDPVNVLKDGINFKYHYTSVDGLGFEIDFCMETDTVKDHVQGCGNKIID